MKYRHRYMCYPTGARAEHLGREQEMKTEEQIRKRLEELERKKKDMLEPPYTEQKRIGWHVEKETLEWVLKD